MARLTYYEELYNDIDMDQTMMILNMVKLMYIPLDFSSWLL